MAIFVSTIVEGQNLVHNPGFEDTIFCPDALDQVDRAIGWTSFRNSPDYFNSCSDSALVDVPANLFGYKNAKSGSAYCGLKTFLLLIIGNL